MSARSTLLSVRPGSAEENLRAHLQRKVVAQHRLQVVGILGLRSSRRLRLRALKEGPSSAAP